MPPKKTAAASDPPAVEPALDEPDEPTVPVTHAEPEPGEDEDCVELVRTGWVRLNYSGRQVKLRRPFFGELKTLRLALEDAADAIVNASDEVQVVALGIIEKGQAIDSDDKLGPAERVEARRKLQAENRVVGRQLTDLAERERLDWWLLVVKTLAVGDDLPDDSDQFPSWIVDSSLPNTVLQHWRSVPLGRG